MEIEYFLKIMDFLSKLERINDRVNSLLDTINKLKSKNRKDLKLCEIVLLSIKEILED